MLTLGDIYGKEAPIKKEFPFGTFTVSPLDIDFWLRLQRDHGKTLDDFLKLNELQGKENQTEAILETTELLVCMFHAATWPYVNQSEYSSDGWKNAIFLLMTTYPVLGEWFLQHILDSMPKGSGSVRPKF
jgi:hypothetical protein